MSFWKKLFGGSSQPPPTPKLPAPAPTTPRDRGHVYDKAEFHYDGDFPEDLEDYQGFVHTGMFVAWLIEHDMIDAEANEEFASGS